MILQYCVMITAAIGYVQEDWPRKAFLSGMLGVFVGLNMVTLSLNYSTTKTTTQTFAQTDLT